MPEVNPYADQINIDTPEQVELRFPIAGVGSRFLALLLDSLIQILIYVLLGLILYVASAYVPGGRTLDHGSNTGLKWLTALFILLNFLMLWGYFSLFEAYWSGQTPGKRVMKLRVLKDSGRSLTLFEALARNLLRIVDLLPGLYLVGVVAMLCNRENKRLGDLVAGTIVVHEGVDEQPLLAHVGRTSPTSVAAGNLAATPLRGAQRWMPDANAEWAAHEVELPADAVALLGPADLHVIETFFSRALDLSTERRAQLATKLAAAMTEKMGGITRQEVSPERLLHLIAFRMRSQGRN